jgi:hypothetical protein
VSRAGTGPSVEWRLGAAFDVFDHMAHLGDRAFEDLGEDE